MGVVFRQSVKNTIVTGVGAVLGALVIWLSTKYIPKQELGFIGNITSYAVTFSQFLLLGLNATAAVYIHKYADNPRKKRLLFSMSVVIPTLVTIVGTIIYYFAKERVLHHFQPADIPFMRRYFMWLPLFTLLFIYMTALEQYLGSQMKVAVSAFMREVLLRVLNITLIVCYGLGAISFTWLVAGTVLIYFIPVLVFVMLASRTPDFGLSFSWSDFSRAEYKELFDFTFYHFLFAMSSTLLGTMDSLAIPLYDKRGFAAVAIYRVSVFFISFVYLPLKAMTTASFVVLARAFNDDQMEKAGDIFNRSSLNIFIATVLVAAALCSNLTNILAIINNGYAEIIPVFLILFVSALVNAATGMNDQVLSIAKYYKFNFYLSIIVVGCMFVAMRYLIPLYGIYGAAWSTTCGVILFNVVKCLFIWQRLGMQPFSRGTILTLVAGAAAFLAGYYFPHFFDQTRHIYVRTFADAAMRGAVVVVVYLLLLLLLKPSKDLQDYLASVKANKRLF